MVKLIQENVRDNVLAFSLHGTIRHEDYTGVIIPALEAKVAHGRKIRALVLFGPDFSGYSAEAVWDDTKLGFTHLTAFEKVAVVTDITWVSRACRIFGILVPAPVRVFPTADAATAMAWVND